MQTENVNIETIERYLRGDMPPAEREAFSARLAADESLQAEVGEVGKLLNGLQSLREEQLLTDFAAWDGEWADSDETDLMEAYLKGELSDENRNLVERRMKADPGFAEQLKLQQNLASGFEAIRSEEFAGQLRAWETVAARAGNTRKLIPMRTVFLRIAAAACVVLAVAVGLNRYADSHFSGWALEDSMYQSPNLGGTMRGEQITDPLVIAFDKGHRQMADKEFLDAEGTFNNVLELIKMSALDSLSQKNYRDNAEWNILLAKLGRNEFGANFQERLDAIAGNPDHTYYDQAVTLKEKMGTFWFRWAN